MVPDLDRMLDLLDDALRAVDAAVSGCREAATRLDAAEKRLADLRGAVEGRLA